MTPNKPQDPLDLSTQDAADHVERMLDRGIEDSFPSSDPVALSQPHSRIEEPPRFLQRMPRMLREWPFLLIAGAVVALVLARRRG